MLVAVALPCRSGFPNRHSTKHLGPRDDPRIGEDDEQERPGDSPTDGVELAGSAAANEGDQPERHRDSLDEQKRRHLQVYHLRKSGPNGIPIRTSVTISVYP